MRDYYSKEFGSVTYGTLQENPDPDTDPILELKIFEYFIFGKWNFQTEFFIFQDFLRPVIKTMSLKFVTIFQTKISFQTR
jgi:hypothetical protein